MGGREGVGSQSLERGRHIGELGTLGPGRQGRGLKRSCLCVEYCVNCSPFVWLSMLFNMPSGVGGQCLAQTYRLADMHYFCLEFPMFFAWSFKRPLLVKK